MAGEGDLSENSSAKASGEPTAPSLPVANDEGAISGWAPESPAPSTAETVTEPPPRPARSRMERRARAASDALRGFIRDFFGDLFGAGSKASDVDLLIRVRLKPAEGWAISFEPALAEQLEDQLADASAVRAAYTRGAVYCYRCERSDCEHARPPTPLSVFAGYDSAGRPTWEDLLQALLRARHPRLDELYGKPPATLAVMRYGRELKGEQLSSFGRASRTYAVLGQVVAGFFEAPAPRGREGSERLALTLQMVESRGSNGEFQLHLNTLARMPDGGLFEHWLGEGAPSSLIRARAVALRATQALEGRVLAARSRGDWEAARRELRAVPAILRELADSLERGERQRRRRTQHVEQRREEQRPVHKAVEDARAARPSDVFVDVKTSAIIVAGPKGRTHAFTAEGRHVTSFMAKPGAAEFRVQTGRWRPAEPAEFEQFRARLP